MLVLLVCFLVGFTSLLLPVHPLAARHRFHHAGRSRRCVVLSVGDGGGGGSSSSSNGDLEAALDNLKAFDDAYLSRLKRARREGRSMAVVELERAQELKGEGLKAERERLRGATALVTQRADSVVLGIMAESGRRGVRALRAWVEGLGLPRGVLRAVDETTGEEVDIEGLDDRPVYIKYNSTERGDAYMKPYDGGNVGVIFQPTLPGNDPFYQFGDLPLPLFG